MPLNKFSTARLNAVVAKGRKGVYGDGGGLWLSITKSGCASWLFRYRSPADGRARAMGLGPLHTVSLAQAREAARTAREARHAGRDPIGERAIRAMTFDACAAEYLRVRKTSVAGWAAVLKRYASPSIGALPVSAITTEHVLGILTPIWTDKTATANRLRRYLETVLEYAGRVKRQRAGENPAAWVQLKHVLPSPKKIMNVEHHASMAPVDLPAFMAELAACDDVAARALAFLILTASRTGDVTGLRWADIDLVRCVWTIPIDKAGNRGFEVPLSEPGVAILRALPRDGELVFGLGKNAMWNLLGEMRPDVTVHGFRSTFRGWALERQLGLEDKDRIVEICLKHAIDRDEVKKAYGAHVRYWQARVRLMELWAQFAVGGEEAKVLHLRSS